MSIERESRLVLNRLMKDNEKSLINEVLDFIRCKYCKHLMDECYCPRCAGVCGNRIFEGCDCDSYCDDCEEKCEELSRVKICDEYCSNTADLCKDCIKNTNIHNKLGVKECMECGDCYCDYCGNSSNYCNSCHEYKCEDGCDCDSCISYEEYKAGQIW